MIKIFADFNNADEKGRIRLNTYGATEDIKNGKIDLKPGLVVLLDDNEGIKTKGIIEFSAEENLWVAVIDWDAIM